MNFITSPKRAFLSLLGWPRRSYVKNYGLTTKSFPTQINIEATNACNFKCKMCPRDKMVRRIGYMSVELFEDIIDEGRKCGLKSVVFAMLGEPLMNRNLPHMIEYAKKNKISVFLSTNASLLTYSMSINLIEAGLDHIHLSMDGATAEVYEKIRVKGVYENVVDNIENFLLELEKRNATVPFVQMALIDMRENHDEFMKLKARWSYFTKKENFRIVMKDYSDWAGKIDSSLNYGRYLYFVNVKLPCSFLDDKLGIYWDGTVTACCIDLNNELNCGNLKEESISQIWNGTRINKIRKIHTEMNFSELDICNRCYGVNKYPIRMLYKKLFSK